MAWAVIVAALASCSENIDTEYQFTAKEETILEYLEQGKNAELYTEYASLLHQVPISRQSS